MHYFSNLKTSEVLVSYDMPLHGQCLYFPGGCKFFFRIQ